MRAPLGDIVRKMLLKKETSKELMKHIILGSRFDLNDSIVLDDKKIKVVRLSSVFSKDNNKTTQ